MATKRKMHHKAKMTIPIAIVAGFVPGVLDVIHNGTTNGWTGSSESGMSTLLGDFMGIQTKEAQEVYHVGGWSPWRLKYGLYPAAAGFLMHWGAQKFGINRMIARAGIPLIRI